MKNNDKLLAPALLGAVLFVMSCGSVTMVTSSWKQPAASADYNNVFVSVSMDDTTSQRKIENGLQQFLAQKGVKVEKSIDIFTVGFTLKPDESNDVAINTIWKTT